MLLTAGTRLGPCEVVASLGAGGMGEVHRARDTRLDRDVALEILPESFAADPDRLTRFQREAKTLASLNHPKSPRSTESRIAPRADGAVKVLDFGLAKAMDPAAAPDADAVMNSTDRDVARDDGAGRDPRHGRLHGVEQAKCCRQAGRHLGLRHRARRTGHAARRGRAGNRALPSGS